MDSQFWGRKKGFKSRASPEKKQRAKELRQNPTPQETKLWQYLRCKKLGQRVYRQRLILGYIVDFWLPKYRLVIELDGGQHYTPEGKIYDKKRDSVLLDTLNILTLRFDNYQVDNYIKDVVKTIKTTMCERNKANISYI